MNFTGVSGRGLASLDGPLLEQLDMSAMAEPEAAVAYLQAKGCVKWLNCGGIQVTDGMIRLLGQTKSLETIWFSRDRVHDQHVDDLKKAIPSVNVLFH